jgi:phenylalanyl-tRNA synthetase beta chain
MAGAEAPAAVARWHALVEALDVHDAELVSATRPGLHPTRSASVIVAGEELGAVGEVHPGVLSAWGIKQRVAWLEVDLGRLLDLPHGEHRYRTVSRYPSSDVDLAFETPATVPASAVAAAIREGAGALLVDLELFDVYRGAGVAAGHRSLAYRLRLQSDDRTLTDSDIGEARRRAIDAVIGATGAALRS